MFNSYRIKQYGLIFHKEILGIGDGGFFKINKFKVSNVSVNDTICIKYNDLHKFEWIINGKMIDINISQQIEKYNKYFAICLSIDSQQFLNCKII